MMSLEGLLDRGVMQGHEVLLIDTAICIDCDNCVDACGRRHGYSRLERSGLQLGNLLFPRPAVTARTRSACSAR